METACRRGRRPWVVSSTLKVLQDKGQPHLLIRRKSGRWFLPPPLFLLVICSDRKTCYFPSVYVIQQDIIFRQPFSFFTFLSPRKKKQNGGMYIKRSVSIFGCEGKRNRLFRRCQMPELLRIDFSFIPLAFVRKERRRENISQWIDALPLIWWSRSPPVLGIYTFLSIKSPWERRRVFLYISSSFLPSTRSLLSTAFLHTYSCLIVPHVWCGRLLAEKCRFAPDFVIIWVAVFFFIVLFDFICQSSARLPPPTRTYAH